MLRDFGGLARVSSSAARSIQGRGLLSLRHSDGRRRRRSKALSLAIAAAGLAAVAAGIGLVTAGGGRMVLQPSQAQITRVMWRTVLVGEPSEHFAPSGQLTMTSDGAGGKLTAEVGTSLPSTDGNGQLVFFWHDNRFVGWDSPVSSMSVLQLQSLGPRSFQVTYSNYRPDDPACCPSLVPISVAYRWSGHRFVAEGPLPTVTPVPGRVRLIR